MQPPVDRCDAACQKIIIDTGMGSEAARLYASVIATMHMRAIHEQAALFYARTVENIVVPVVQAMSRGKLTEVQSGHLMTQIDEQCYRADTMIEWARADDATIIAHAEAWTDKLFEWVKADQEFYTGLSAEVKR